MDALTFKERDPAPVLSRKERRAREAIARRAGFSAMHNSLSHASITEPAFRLLVAELEKYGNILSVDHKTALMALVGLMTKMAQHKLNGRFAFGLPTGLGKSTAIIAFAAALAARKIDHVSIAVACSKVEALCQMKRDMIALGVEPARIGLIHSYPDATERSTEDEDRQIMLVTHARVRDSSKLAQFSHYRGKPRDLLIYDESLIVSDSIGLALRDLKGCIGYLEKKYDDSEKHGAAVRYLQSCLDVIQAKLDALGNDADGEASGEAIIELPPLDHVTREAHKATLGKSAVVLPGLNLLEIGQDPVRVIKTGNGGVVSYTVAVPKELRNILVLDASHPIRRLVHLDRTIKDAEKEQEDVRRIAPLAKLKQFDQVTIHQMFAGGGRSTMAADFGNDKRDSKIVAEVIEVIKTIPRTEAVLIFTYKDRDGVRFTGKLRDELARAGIDVKATVPVSGPYGMPTEKSRINIVTSKEEKRDPDRINILTWGNETSLSKFSYVENVILCGIVQRSAVDLAAAYLGQTNKLEGAVSYKRIAELIRTECAHAAYQALSRGSSRVIENGHAKRMNAWIIHRDATIQTELSTVMPGVVWRTWTPKTAAPSRGAVATVATRVATYLKELPAETGKLSTRSLKQATGLTEVANRTFTHALETVEKLVAWKVEGRSLVRSNDQPKT
jgi:hypothetical protein